MPYILALPGEWKHAGWKVRIAEKERVEPPHVTIRCRDQAWRLGLRDGRFLDRRPPPGKVPGELVEWVKAAFPTLIREWDRKYPENRVKSDDCHEHG
ncbi:MAG TPA: hypothetical protein VFJ16_22235 [Longimicrobium sp.]|nr:hypothetical protein [Longimicrobium sp.]